MRNFPFFLVVLALGLLANCGKDSDDDGSGNLTFEEFVQKYFTPEIGFQVKTVESADKDGEVSNRQTYKYDSEGRMISEKSEFLEDGKLTLSSSRTLTRDGDGQVTKEVSTDVKDGKEYTAEEITTTYSGSMITRRKTVAFNETGDETTSDVEEMDKFGRVETDTITKGGVTTIETCEFDSESLVGDYTCTSKVEGKVTEVSVHDSAKRTLVTTSFKNAEAGKVILSEKYFADNIYVAETSVATDDDDGDITESECTLKGDELTCTESEKTKGGVKKSKKVSVNTLKKFNLNLNGTVISDYPWLFDTKVTEEDFTDPVSESETTTSYNSAMLAEKLTIDITDDDGQTVDVLIGTFDKDGRRPLTKKLERTKGEGSPIRDNTTYNY